PTSRLSSQVPLADARSKLKDSCLWCSCVLFQHSVETFAATSRLRGAESTKASVAEQSKTECSPELQVDYLKEAEAVPQHWLSNLAPFSLPATSASPQGS
ncbi:hypothetical protein Nmel_000757, partial [Mimus melanotis]